MNNKQGRILPSHRSDPKQRICDRQSRPCCDAHLQTFKQEILSFELIEPVGVDDEDSIVKDKAKTGPDHQHFSSILIRPWPSKQGIHYRRYCLQYLTQMNQGSG